MIAHPDAALVLLLALAIDALVGDPDRIWRRWPHPVVWLGGMIGWGDRVLNRESLGPEGRRWCGGALLAGLLLLASGAAYLVEEALRSLPGGWLLVSAVASIFIAQRSLVDHVARVRDAFAEGGLPDARRAVSMIVGRDPETLDESGVARAAIESTAENFSDGVVAPAFWFVLLGLPGLVAYKAANTADSMIGHLSARHREFGWAAARFDDLVNLLPARAAGALIGLAAPVAGGRARLALRMMMRDAGLHRSPNAGWPEAAMAGALGVALAGPRTYASGVVADPFLHREGRPAGPPDIGRGLRVMMVAAGLHAAGYGALALLVG